MSPVCGWWRFEKRSEESFGNGILLMIFCEWRLKGVSIQKEREMKREMWRKGKDRQKVKQKRREKWETEKEENAKQKKKEGNVGKKGGKLRNGQGGENEKKKERNVRQEGEKNEKRKWETKRDTKREVNVRQKRG